MEERASKILLINLITVYSYIRSELELLSSIVIV